MKTFALIAIAGVASALVAEDDFNFYRYAAEFNKSYGSTEEFAIRQAEWKKSDDAIKAHNADENKTFTLGHNYMSDWTHEEYKVLLGYRPQEGREYNPVPYVKSDATSVNWVEKGAVTPVKDQGQCGSCWAFSSTGCLEGAHWRATGELVSYSESELVDCDRGILKNHGCNGGLMDNAFKWLKDNALATEADYPYTPENGTCNESAKAKGLLTVSDYVDVTKNDADALKA